MSFEDAILAVVLAFGLIILCKAFVADLNPRV
jgi:hypothetical protein